ncbi:MAG: DUF1501 domain-containing protein [Planctomycetota bacterium]|nr:MAG: DUF1501 domain-containing protein [Planctomycetota bacterium]REJ93111.1 MAG: DUF1501 domain-containing protein [Planctomycetota bacterium]REK30099.1 MAG: DUF1501 domain-containing protein [Planctomycetota bacterium]REK37659.1 MAG: DUF1501 domain-containing protein [Planctomycetota bacterium]
MLQIGGQSARRDRRDFLKVGSLALGGAALPEMVARHLHAAEVAPPISDKSVVFVFMHGGPSQIETFDPKMTAPPGVCSANGEVATNIPGVTYGYAFPRLAALADKTAIVRSFTTGDGNHNIKPVVDKATYGANLGSLYARVAGANRPDSGMPTNVALYPRAVDDSTMPAIKQFGEFESTGTLGSAYAPFAPSGGSDLRENMKLELPVDRLDDRRRLLAGLDRIQRTIDAGGKMEGVDNLRRQAFDALLGGVAEAFDLSQESPDTIARYDTAPLVRPEAIDKKWNNHERYADNAKSIGKLMLLARRLCERGAGFVTVTTNFVWDMHADQNNAGVVEGMRYMGLPFDHAVSAFIEDVHQRGLDEKILLVCCGEMGRTPKINARGGRDHWGGLAPLLLSGGGLRMGQVIGQSTRDASQPLTEPIRIPNLVSTILHTLMDVGQVRLIPGLPADVIKAATNATPIPGLT